MKKFVLMSVAAMTVGLYSCSDKLTEDANVVVEQPQSDGITEGYVAFKVNSISTRADGNTPADNAFEEGEADESAINPTLGANVAFFFDKNKNYHSMSILNLTSEGSNVSHGDHTSATGSDLEKYYEARVIKEMDENVESCILILNGDPESFNEKSLGLEKGTTTLKKFREKTTKAYKNGKYFTMSNSVYINNNDNLSGAVNIVGKICSSMEEAQANKISVHVERIAVKYSLTFGENVGIVTPSDNKVSVVVNGKEEAQSWAVRIIGYNINALEKESYWVKNLHDGNNFAQTTDEMTNTSFGKWTKDYSDASSSYGWNDYARLRSYWAVDPNYNSGYYPQQYRPALDNTSVQSNAANNTLSYISYNEIGTDLNGNRYSHENTFGAINGVLTASNVPAYDFKGTGYKRTSTHILVAAELLLGDEVTSTPTTVSDKYNYENKYWTDKKELIEYMAEAVLLYDYKKLYTDESAETEYKDEEASEYFDLTAATLKGGDGRVMLTLKAGKKLYYKSEGEVKEWDISATSNSVQTVGTARHFSAGKMYYYIPIKHMAPIAELEDVTANNENTTYYCVGSYGVVRNHWYKINVSAIKAPGIPVDDPDQPVIPNDEQDNGAYASFEIVIIPWHILEDSNVEL